MESYLDRPFTVSASQCDATWKMSIPAVFTLFQDLAGNHANLLGIGGRTLAEKGLFWLTIRTKVQIHRLPGLDEEVVGRTWIGTDSVHAMRTDRYYSLKTTEGEVLALGRTEWGVFSLSEQRLVRIREIRIPDIPRLPETALTESFLRLPAKAPEAAEAFRHTVSPMDIDMGHHMNNCAYIRALWDTYSVREMQELSPKEIEICFRTPCLEGEDLMIERFSGEDNRTNFIIRKPDGSVGALAAIR